LAGASVSARIQKNQSCEEKESKGREAKKRKPRGKRNPGRKEIQEEKENREKQISGESRQACCVIAKVEDSSKSIP